MELSVNFLPIASNSSSLLGCVVNRFLDIGSVDDKLPLILFTLVWLGGSNEKERFSGQLTSPKP